MNTLSLPGLACRTLDPTKILVLGRCRLLLNCSGIFDVLTYDPNSANPMAAMSVYQQVHFPKEYRELVKAKKQVSLCTINCRLPCTVHDQLADTSVQSFVFMVK